MPLGDLLTAPAAPRGSAFEGFVRIVDPDDPARTPGMVVLRYHQQHEASLTRRLEGLGAPAIVLKFTRRLPRKQGIVVSHWFPGYAFLSLDPERDRFQQVKRLPGSLGFPGGDPPIPLQDRIWNDIVIRCPDKPAPNGPETVIPNGAKLEVLSGPLRGHHGFATRSAGRRVWMTATMLGGPCIVELATNQVIILAAH